jgi:hypothetical protein
VGRNRHLDIALVTIGTLVLLAAPGCAREPSDRPVVSRSEAGRTRSPSGVAAAGRDRSLVRLINAVPGAPLTISADGEALFTGIRPGAVTPYREVADNVVTFRLRTAPEGPVIAENEETIADGFRYSLLALPADEGRGIRIRLLRDEVVRTRARSASASSTRP